MQGVWKEMDIEYDAMRQQRQQKPHDHTDSAITVESLASDKVTTDGLLPTVTGGDDASLSPRLQTLPTDSTAKSDSRPHSFISVSSASDGGGDAQDDLFALASNGGLGELMQAIEQLVVSSNDCVLSRV